ncbi:hypothetical protein SOVF_100990 [Spinacia oleracea]|nr:hypothetical protein SOVF_100990 [Spinacia oleracea]
MEDHHQATKTTSNNISTTTTTASTSSSSKGGGDRTSTSTTTSGGEPVRSRWTPKPEQILILESIFNSGMVNPPKEETVRIRKLLEKFGAVGDANVFYWFQNRRSRSRRRQRQLQASLAASVATPTQTPPQQPPPHPGYFDLGHHRTTSTCTIPTSSSSGVTCFAPCNSTSSSTTFCDYGGGVVDDVFGNYSGQMDLVNSTNHQMDHRSSNSSNIDFQSGKLNLT